MWTCHLSFSKEYHAQSTISGMWKFFELPRVEVHEWFLDPRKQPSCTIHKRQRKRPQTNHISFVVKGFKSILRVWWWWKVLSKTWSYGYIFRTWIHILRMQERSIRRNLAIFQECQKKSIRNLAGYLRFFRMQSTKHWEHSFVNGFDNWRELGIWRRRGEKNNWVRIHHMDTWIHRILQMRNKSRGSLFST